MCQKKKNLGIHCMVLIDVWLADVGKSVSFYYTCFQHFSFQRLAVFSVVFFVIRCWLKVYSKIWECLHTFLFMLFKCFGVSNILYQNTAHFRYGIFTGIFYNSSQWLMYMYSNIWVYTSYVSHIKNKNKSVKRIANVLYTSCKNKKL